MKKILAFLSVLVFVLFPADTRADEACVSTSGKNGMTFPLTAATTGANGNYMKSPGVLKKGEMNGRAKDAMSKSIGIFRILYVFSIPSLQREPHPIMERLFCS